MEKVRDDKEYFDCMTTDELEQLKHVILYKYALKKHAWRKNVHV